MNRISVGLIAAGTLFVGGCIIIDADDVDATYDFDRGWGSVYAADVSADTITITVSDNGCTTKDFFGVDVDEEDDLEFEVGFERIRADHCKMLNPAGQSLTWTYSELGIPQGASVSIRNRVRRY